MIYLKTSVGVELRGEDMLISSLQNNFSGGVFTHFTRIAGCRQRNPEDLKREINAFFRSRGLSRENIVLGIPRKDIVLRYLDLPAEVADNLKQVVQYQVQSFEPTDEDKFYHDYSLIQGNGAGKRLTVMLAMVRKAMLDEILHFLLTLGIRPAVVVGSSMGLANLVLTNGKDPQNRTMILGDLSASSLEIVALRQGAMVYSREVAKESQQAWKDVILHETDEAASKIRLGPEGVIDKVILAGESSENACAEIQDVLPDCDLIRNCIGNLDIPGENKPRIQEASSALGLAYTGLIRRPAIRINLLPQDRRIQQSRWAYVPAAILGLAILVLLAALAYRGTVQNRALARTLDQQIQSLKGSVERVQSYRVQSEALNKKTKAIEELLNGRDMNLELLKELSTILPNDAYLQSYKCADGVVTISGFSTSASDLIPQLEKSPLLKDVVAKGVIYKDASVGKERFTFEARLEK
jgi:Tfp pilus assembly protein PilN